MESRLHNRIGSLRQLEILLAVYEEGGEMLFDHDLDPDENINVAQKAEYANILKEMQKYLEDAKIRAKDLPEITVK